MYHPARTLLEVLREDLGCHRHQGRLRRGRLRRLHRGAGRGRGRPDCHYRAVNSCIRLAHSVDGLAVWTVEDLAGADGALHPAQEAMVRCHGSQCGFCTPGFVMSLFGMYQNHVCKGESITRALAQEELSGNLCRCTGYRPILDAAQAMAALPPARVDETALLRQLQFVQPEAGAPSQYLAPRTLAGLLQARAGHPQAQLVAGCTDVGLWVTKLHMEFGQVLDVTRVQELRRIEHYPQHIAIGAAVTLADAYAALVQDRPQLHSFAGALCRPAGAQLGHAGRQRRQRLADRRLDAAADRAGRERGADECARAQGDAAGEVLHRLSQERDGGG
jgi:xanthine dehydrogenase small subunit